MGDITGTLIPHSVPPPPSQNPQKIPIKNSFSPISPNFCPNKPRTSSYFSHHLYSFDHLFSHRKLEFEDQPRRSHLCHPSSKSIYPNPKQGRSLRFGQFSHQQSYSKSIINRGGKNFKVKARNDASNLANLGSVYDSTSEVACACLRHVMRSNFFGHEIVRQFGDALEVFDEMCYTWMSF